MEEMHRVGQHMEKVELDAGQSKPAEKCEWEWLPDRGHYGIPCEPKKKKWFKHSKWNFCPFCGKRLEVRGN